MKRERAMMWLLLALCAIGIASCWCAVGMGYENECTCTTLPGQGCANEGVSFTSTTSCVSAAYPERREIMGGMCAMVCAAPPLDMAGPDLGSADLGSADLGSADLGSADLGSGDRADMAPAYNPLTRCICTCTSKPCTYQKNGCR